MRRGWKNAKHAEKTKCLLDASARSVLSALILAAFLLSGWRLREVSALVQAEVDFAKEPIVNLLSALGHRDPALRRAARRELERRRDPRAVPGLIELLRYRPNNERGEIDWLLQKLTGRSFDVNWILWHQWMVEQPRLELPPQFLEFKAALLRSIDPNFDRFLYAGMPLRIRVEEIVWGGVKTDGIPALDNPKLIEAEAAAYLNEKEPVFSVEINGDARAYPLRIMDWHEMLNDVIGGQPVSLAYCTLCRGGILFDTRAGDRTFTFGSSGLLYRGNKLMYDRETHSLWMTIPGEPAGATLCRKVLVKPCLRRLSSRRYEFNSPNSFGSA